MNNVRIEKLEQQLAEALERISTLEKKADKTAAPAAKKSTKKSK